jgi:2',3'-cyclic-nucleotide 2'-phosphodiesterase (5'-nucleotidase family)
MQSAIPLASMVFGVLTGALTSGVQASRRPGVARDTVRLVVVATTDVHAHATGWDYALERPFAGGLTRVATVVDSLRRVHGDYLVLVDAGDLLQGNPLGEYLAREPRDPHPIIGLMNAMGYDAVTPGNHDFDFGVPFLQRAVAGATFKYVSGNVRALPSDTLMFPAYVVVRHGALRVAIGGFTTPGVNLWDRAQLAGKARVLPISAAAPAALSAMRRSGDVSIVLSHSGFSGGSTYDAEGIGQENEAAVLAQGPDAPDLVVVGHTHREVRDTIIGRTHFTQPRNYAQSVSVTHILLEQLPSGRWKVLKVAPDLIPVGETEESRRVSGRMTAAHDDATRWLTQPIGRASAPFPGQLGRVEPTPLVNFIHAVQRERTGAQLSATPLFRPEAGFPQGDIRRGNVAGVYPYENTLMAIRVTGAQLRAYLEQSARYWAMTPEGRLGVNRQIPGYNFDMVSGAEYELDPSKAVGARIRNLKVKGREVEPADTFSLALNSYRASGAGGYGVLAGAPVLYDKGENVRQLLVQAIEERQVLDPKQYGEDNWRLVPAAAHQQARALFGVGAVVARPDTSRVARPASRERVGVRLLTINDLHGALAPRTYPWSQGREVGGVATLDAMMDSAAAECRCPTIRLSAGDEMQGTLESNLVFGKSTVLALNQMRIAAAAIGNHELDWGQDTLRARMRDARFPWLSANIFDSATGQRPDWVAPWQLFQLDTLRVAVVGYTHSGTKGIVMPENAAGLTFGTGASSIGDVLEDVKEVRPHLTILVAHEGGFCDSVPGCRGEIFDLARALPAGSVDAIVAGHTHALLDTEVNGIPIIEARSSGTALGVLDLRRLPEGRWAGRREVRPAYVDQVTPDSALAEMTYQVRRQTQPLAQRRIGSLAQPLVKSGERDETTIGNFIADAQRNALRTDVAIMNGGGVRASLAAGDVTYEHLYTVQPFGNRIYALTLTGRELRQALETAVEEGHPYAGISGMTVTWDPGRPAGERVREIVLSTRKKVRDKETYTVAVNGFMAAGGSGYTALVGKPRGDDAFGDVEVLETWLKRQAQPVRAPALGRWRRVK